MKMNGNSMTENNTKKISQTINMNDKKKNKMKVNSKKFSFFVNIDSFPF